MIVFVCCGVKAVFMSRLRSRAATGRDAEAEHQHDHHESGEEGTA